MSRILVVAAHPDDEVLGMGGTIALHTSRGDQVRVLVVTDGSSTQYPGDDSGIEVVVGSESRHPYDWSRCPRRACRRSRKPL